MDIRNTVDHDAVQVRSARLLGLSGLIPFAALPVLALAAPFFTRTAVLAMEGWLLLYAAVIVSFMSGTRWAFRVLDPDRGQAAVFAGFLGAVTPALAAWVVVALPEVWAGRVIGHWPRFLVLALLLLFQLGQDWAHRRRGGPIAGWYWQLRVVLALGASGSILLGWLIALL